MQDMNTEIKSFPALPGVGIVLYATSIMLAGIVDIALSRSHTNTAKNSAQIAVLKHSVNFIYQHLDKNLRAIRQALRHTQALDSDIAITVALIDHRNQSINCWPSPSLRNAIGANSGSMSSRDLKIISPPQT